MHHQVGDTGRRGVEGRLCARGQGLHRESLYLPPQFCYEPKTALKIVFFRVIAAGLLFSDYQLFKVVV